MTTSNSNPFQLKSIFTFLVILALTITSTTSARRILDEEPIVAPDAPDDTNESTPASGLSTGVGAGIPAPAGVAAPAVHAGVAAPAVHAGADINPATAGAGEDDHIFSFFMHDILGGSNPSAIAVTGIATNPSLSGQVPFAKPNGAVLAVDNGVPVNNGNSGIISNNNIPFLTGLSGTTPNVVQNNGNNNNIIGGGNGYPALNMAQLGSGVTFQKLMFGTLTVFDDELTEGHELNSGLVGKSQGFYISSSEDGSSQTMAFTVMFHSGSYSDSLSFFGVHRVRVSESHLAIMGGTGKYVNAKGFATVKTFPAANQETDGVETLLHITVYLAY
ncbi:dirigent protein 10-like isoform X1 [Solanum stenotomum]|uniref:dirigent protein 10-like isoform X1 n=1 Tax=Solanum stenotomum TaxID=172797 RepID=UPI0020D195E4|nr:dirigent protein 10-like isoform X1 [Solanum stenotomum]